MSPAPSFPVRRCDEGTMTFATIVLLLVSCAGDKGTADTDTAAGSVPDAFGALIRAEPLRDWTQPDPVFALGGTSFAVPTVGVTGDTRFDALQVVRPEGTFSYASERPGFPYADGAVVVHPREGVWIERVAQDGTPLWSLGGEGEVFVDASAAEGDEAWFSVYATYGLPEMFRDTEHPENGSRLALVRVRLTDGAVQDVVATGDVRTTGPLAWLEDGGVVHLGALLGPVVRDGVTYGRAGARLSLVEAFNADGTSRWRRVLGPDAALYDRTVVGGPEGLVLVEASVEGEIDFGDAGGVATRAFVAAFDGATGDLRWVHHPDDGTGGALAVREDGRIVWLRERAGEGTMNVIGAYLLDPCGNTVAEREWVYCDCQFDAAAARATFYAADWSPEGDLWFGAAIEGPYRFSGNPPGGSAYTEGDVGAPVANAPYWVVGVEGPPPVDDATCEMGGVPDPELRVRVEGDGAVTIQRRDGAVLGTCAGDCAFPVRRYEQVVLTPTAGEGQVLVGWTGPCEGAGACEVFVEGDVTVRAAFAPTAFDAVTLFGGEILEARLGVGPDGGALAYVSIYDGLTVEGEAVAAPSGLSSAVMAFDEEGRLLWSAVRPYAQPLAVVPRADGGVRAVGYESGALHVAEYDATGALQSDLAWNGIGGSGFWAEDGAGHPFLADNTRTTLAHLYRRDGERMEEVAAFASSSVLVVDVVGRADGVAVLVSHNAGATLAGVTTTAWGASLVVFDGLGSLESVTALPVEAPRGFFKPSEGRSWEGDLALVGTGSRSGTFGVWWEPVDAAGALTGTPFEMPDIEPDGFVPFRARPWGGGVLAAARDLAVVDRFKAALARYDGAGGGEVLEVAHGPNADTWLATASDGADVFVALARLDDGTLSGQAVTGPVLVRVER